MKEGNGGDEEDPLGEAWLLPIKGTSKVCAKKAQKFANSQDEAKEMTKDHMYYERERRREKNTLWKKGGSSF